jgi:hypothetical protein
MHPPVISSALRRQTHRVWPTVHCDKKGSTLVSFAALALAAAISGCGSGNASHPMAGSIVLSSSAGVAMTKDTVALATSINLSMMPTNDPTAAGVDWSITCQGNPVTGSLSNGACGTLAPAHTADGKPTVYTAPSLAPINSDVTVTASVTSNPSQTSAVTFSIVSVPIGVQFVNTTLPASLVTNTTLTLSAQVTGDPADSGIIWSASCNASACGSFNPTVTASSGGIGNVYTTYTAPSVTPAGGSVTLTATSLTDTTKAASATIGVAAPPAPSAVTVNVLPAAVYVETTGSAHTTTLQAVVGDDPANAGVDWSLNCAATSCGVITVHTASGAAASYIAPSTAPSGGTVTITASSTANPSVSATSVANVVTTAPILVKSSSTPPATLLAGSQATLAATVTGDTNNFGVNWSATCGTFGACGTFNLSPAHTASGVSIVYTAPTSVPSGGEVILTASSASSSPSNPAIALISILAQSPSLSFAAMPPSTMAALAQSPVSAVVANDSSPNGIDWLVQCGNTTPGACGWILPVHTASGVAATYTAPPVTNSGTVVTITATSTADPGVSLSSAPIAINPSTALAVSFVPFLPAQIQPNSTVNLTASVANDAADAGVDWQVCSSGCGFFTITPAIPAIPVTSTTPYIPAVPAVTATSVSAWSSGLPIPYTAPEQAPSSGVVAVAAFAHAEHTAAISGTIAVDATSTGPALHGLVRAGSQPVAGATVALYAAGTSGYASAASQLASASTAKDGSFTIPAQYACPASSSQMYLVATGGSAGSNSANPNLALMTALGGCANLPSTTVVINEVTTVASAYATAPFSANDALNGNSSYLYLGASSGNLTGLANAFASVNNLVNISTGQPNFFTNAGNASVPFVLINTLADALNACTATSGGVEGDGSACSTLFTATDLLREAGSGIDPYSGGIGPFDTLQAAFNIAQHPLSTYYGYSLDLSFLNLATTSSSFQPILSSSPNDLSLSLNYSVGGLNSSVAIGSFAIDAGGNLWITDTAAGAVIEWNSNAAVVSPPAGFAAGGGPVGIDASGNAWISGNGVLNELTSLGTVVPGSPYAGVAGGGADLAFDAQSNLWIANGGGVSEFDNLGALLSPPGGFTFSGLSNSTAVGIDSSNDVWLGDADSTSSNVANFTELSNPGAQFIVNGSTGIGGSVLPGIAADNAGNTWSVLSSGSVCEVPPYGGAGSNLVDSINCISENAQLFPFFNPAGLAIDGAGILWIASPGGGTVPIVLPSIFPLSLSLNKGNNGGGTGFLASPSLVAGPMRLAIDGSGNVWVLLANNTVTEYVGVATPVVTPTALAVKNNKLAAKP